MTAVLPGGTIGVLGGGQLGRMLALEARRMGYRIGVLDPTPGCAAAQVADFHVAAPLDDADAALDLAARADVVTLETEHIDADLLARVEARVPLRPASGVLRTIQDRLVQKDFLARQGFPQPVYAAVADQASLEAAGRAVGFPAVLKSRRAGYDGKGQARVERAADLVRAWEAIGRVPAVLEAFVPFRMELSVILARASRGRGDELRCYPIAENVHRRHILHTTRVPARVAEDVRRRAEEIAAGIARALGHCGVMAVEMFLLPDDRLLVNEIAPRTHNSGHFTLGACVTSQFEQHVRAVCGLPLGEPSLLRPAVMVNLLGDLWQSGPPRWSAVLERPEARLHLYGKTPAVPGRKMGHVLLLDDDTDRALAVAEEILAGLAPPHSA